MCAIIWNVYLGLLTFLPLIAIHCLSLHCFFVLWPWWTGYLKHQNVPCPTLDFLRCVWGVLCWICWDQEQRCSPCLAEETFVLTHCPQLRKSISGLAIKVMNILGTWNFGKFPDPSNTETLLTSRVLLSGCLLMTWTIFLLHFVTAGWCHMDVLIKLSSTRLEEWNWCLSDHSLS